VISVLLTKVTGKNLPGYDKTQDTIIADANFAYGLTENFSFVASTTLRSLTDGGNLNSYSGGVLWSADQFSVELGYQYHDASNAIDMGEAYANVGFVCPWTGTNLNLFYAYTTNAYTDAFEDGQYLELSGLKSFEITNCISIDLSAGISYSIDYWANKDTWNSYYVTVGMPVKASENLTITPYVTYTDGLGVLDYASDVVLGDDDYADRVFWGVKASVKF